MTAKQAAEIIVGILGLGAVGAAAVIYCAWAYVSHVYTGNELGARRRR